MRVRLPITLFVCVVLGLSTTAVAAGASSDELVTRNVEKAGIAIDAPKGWTGREIDPTRLAEGLKELERTDPRAARALRQILRSGALDDSRFVAVDPLNGDTLNVLVVPQPIGETIGDLKALAYAPSWKALGYSLLEVTEMQVGTYPAVKMVQKAKPKGTPLGIYQVDLWIQLPNQQDVDVALVVDNTKRNRALVNRILGSIRTL